MPNVPSYDHVERQIGDPGLTADVVAMSLQVEFLTNFINQVQALEPAPQLQLLTPDTGPAGTTVTVTGLNLQGITGLSLGLLPLSFQRVSSTSLSFVLPVGVDSGPVVGTYAQGQVNGPVFSVPNILPTVGAVNVPASTPALANLQASIDATDLDGIDVVEFLVRSSSTSPEQSVGATALVAQGLYRVVFNLPTAGAYQIRARVKDGRGGIAYSGYTSLLITAAVLTPPAPPTILANDQTNSLQAAAPTEVDSVEVSENNGPWTAYAGLINVGNVNKAAGYWRFRTAARGGYPVSNLSLSPAFTSSNTTAASIQNVVLSAPASGTVRATVTLVGSASSTSSLTKAEFLVDSQLVGTDTTSPYQALYTPTTNGVKQLQVRFTNADGTVATSQAVAFSVADEVVVNPTPTNTTPAAPTYQNFTDTQAGGSVRIVPASGVAISQIRYSLPGTSEFIELPEGSDGTVSVSNVAGSVQAYTIAAGSFNASNTSSSPAFTVYTPPATPTFNTTLNPGEFADVVTYNGAPGTQFLFNAPLPVGDPAPAVMLLYLNGTAIGQVDFNNNVAGTACGVRVNGTLYLTTFQNSDNVALTA